MSGKQGRAGRRRAATSAGSSSLSRPLGFLGQRSGPGVMATRLRSGAVDRGSSPWPGAAVKTRCESFATLPPVDEARAACHCARAGLLVAALVLAACGGDDSPEQPIVIPTDDRPPAPLGQDRLHRGGRRRLRRGERAIAAVRRHRRGLHARPARSPTCAQVVIDDLKALGPPAEDRATLDQFLTALEAQVEAGEKIALANERGEDTAQFETELDTAKARGPDRGRGLRLPGVRPAESSATSTSSTDDTGAAPRARHSRRPGRARHAAPAAAPATPAAAAAAPAAPAASAPAAASRSRRAAALAQSAELLRPRASSAQVP